MAFFCRRAENTFAKMISKLSFFSPRGTELEKIFRKVLVFLFTNHLVFKKFLVELLYSVSDIS